MRKIIVIIIVAMISSFSYYGAVNEKREKVVDFTTSTQEENKNVEETPENIIEQIENTIAQAETTQNQETKTQGIENEKITTPIVKKSNTSENNKNSVNKEATKTIESEDCTPSYSQAIRMKELSKQNKLDMDAIFNIMIEQKPNQKEQIRFKVEKLKSYFPKGYSTKQMEDVIEKLLKQYKQKWKNKDLER